VQEGARVVFCDVDRSSGQALCADLPADRCRFAHCDVSQEQDVREVLSSLEALDIVVNNAAVFEFARVEDCTAETWDRVLGVNVKGYAYVVKHALPLLRRSQRSPSIVNLGSISSFIAQPAFVPYNTSKGAILQLTRCLAMDLAADNIRVNAVCPGGTSE
jgi:NAD(P)-dependent dehydrogenase (short-subunit alcohol dehydrogenase family)